MAFLREHGKQVKVHWWQWHWELLHVSRGGVLSNLAAFVADHAITSLAVWFTVWDSDEVCLLEMEGGNNYIWLAKEFEAA